MFDCVPIDTYVVGHNVTYLAFCTTPLARRCYGYAGYVVAV
ncbi:hypothetical protein GA0071314_1617 [Halomonas sp. HL-93]|nr:MAG: hypothetical protein HLUCCO06_14755 [Halomonas sp. HL-93]SBR48274.1 hypothetical protein GA0071314_1617 [Halomonas sp. HL-93]